MGNDTLMTEVDNSQVYDSKPADQERNDVSETYVGCKIDMPLKTDVNDMAAISNLTPRLYNQPTSKIRTESNSEMKKSSKGINLVRDTGRDLKMRGPSKAGSNMNLYQPPSSSIAISPPKLQ